MPQALFKEMSQKESCFKPGSTLCRGCMESIAFNNLGKATHNGKKTIFTMGTFCGEVSTLAWPNVVAWGRGNESPDDFKNSFGIIHNVFESAPTVAEGVRDVADMLKDFGALNEDLNVVSNSGDGGALAIGLRPFLHTINRGSRVVLVVLINELYANTGFQYGPATSLFSDSSTTPVGQESRGNPQPPLNHIGLAVMAGAGFVAQVSPAFPKDFADAVTCALDCSSTAVIFVPAPCITGWKFDEGRTIELARLASKSGIFPVFTKERGKPGLVRRVDAPKKRLDSLLLFLSAQRRFDHLVFWDKRESKPRIQLGAEKLIQQFEEWIGLHIKDLENIAKLT